MHISSFFTVSMISLAVGLAACAPRGVPIVSSSPNYKSYVHATAVREKSYVSALESAKSEGPYNNEGEHREYGDYTLDQSSSVANGLDSEMEEAFVSAMMQSSMHDKQTESTIGVVGRAENADLLVGQLWGKPPTFLGDGVTIMNKQIRKRFNDAIATTPIQGKVEWRYGKNQFIFMPNSEIYQPFYSGGNCRDGVFIHFDGEKNNRMRSLFCQQGIGSDWFIQK